MYEELFKYVSMVKNFFEKIYQNYFTENVQTKRCAWLTVICNDEYLPGVLALARSLKRVKTIYPLVVLFVEDNVSKDVQQQIANEGCTIRSIQALIPEQQLSDLAFKHFMFAWTKLRAFELTDVADECVVLDCDMIVLNNLDDVFQLDDHPDFAAVQTCICNPAKNPNYPEFWNPNNCPYTHEEHENNSVILDERSRMFNGGFFLIHPNKEVFQEILKCLDAWDLSQFKFAEQDFLNKFYKNKWRRLPSTYNSLKTFSITHPHIWDTSKIKIIHYILGKPWNKTDETNKPFEEINRLWWEAFEYKSD